MTDTTVRPRRVLRVVLVTLLVTGLGVAAVGTIAFCSVFGCTFFSEDFEPQGEEATAARAAASTAVAELADGASVDGRVIGSATRDHCSEGQNNWKRKDTYSHECTVDAGRIVALTSDASAGDPVADGLTRAAASLERAGCRGTEWGGLERVRDEYWTPFNPNVVRAGGAAGLPSARYDCADGRQLEVEPTASKAPDDELRSGLGLPRSGYDDPTSDWFGPDDLEALQQADVELALVVTASETYYRTRF